MESFILLVENTEKKRGASELSESRILTNLGNILILSNI